MEKLLSRAVAILSLIIIIIFPLFFIPLVGMVVLYMKIASRKGE